MTQIIQSRSSAVRRKEQGFTLVELMIVVVVVGILAGISYPAFQEYARRAKRAEARVALMDTAARLERFYSDENRYIPDDDDDVSDIVAPTSGKNHYNISYDSDSPWQTFELVAEPNGFDDDKCDELKLTNTGAQTISGTGSPEECWGK